VPSKNGKDGKKTFNFNRVFGPSSTQGWSFYCPSVKVIVTLYMFAHGFFFVFCSGGFLRYTTTDSFGSWWLQRVYICLWSDRIRKNTHYGERFRLEHLVTSSMFSASYLQVITVVLHLCIDTVWTRQLFWGNSGCQLPRTERSFPSLRAEKRHHSLWYICSDAWDLQWTSQGPISDRQCYQKISFLYTKLVVFFILDLCMPF